MKHHLNFAVSLHGNRLWNSKYHYGIKHDMKLENSVHGNLSRNNTFPSVTRNWKYYTHETQTKCLVNVSCEYSCKQMNVKENSIFFAVWDFSSDLVSEQVGFTSICAVVKCLVAWTWSSFNYMAHGSDPTPVWPATILTRIEDTHRHNIISFTYCFVLVLANN